MGSNIFFSVVKKGLSQKFLCPWSLVWQRKPLPRSSYFWHARIASSAVHDFSLGNELLQSQESFGFLLDSLFCNENPTLARKKTFSFLEDYQIRSRWNSSMYGIIIINDACVEDSECIINVSNTSSSCFSHILFTMSF